MEELIISPSSSSSLASLSQETTLNLQQKLQIMVKSQADWSVYDIYWQASNHEDGRLLLDWGHFQGNKDATTSSPKLTQVKTQQHLLLVQQAKSLFGSDLMGLPRNPNPSLMPIHDNISFADMGIIARVEKQEKEEAKAAKYYLESEHSDSVKQMMGPSPHTQLDADLAGGMGLPDNGPKLMSI